VGTGWDSNLQADPFLGNSQPKIDVQMMSVTRIGEVNGVNTFNTSRTGAGHSAPQHKSENGEFTPQGKASIMVKLPDFN